MWEFETFGVPEGGSAAIVIGGTFMTDGEYADTQGSKTFEFTVSEFTTFTQGFNKQDITSDFNTLPSTPNEAANAFQWDSQTQKVTGWESQLNILEATGGEGGDSGDSGPQSKLVLAFPTQSEEGGTQTQDFQLFDSDGAPNFNLAPFGTTLTPLAPVPEVEELATAIFGVLLGFIVWRRSKTTIPMQWRALTLRKRS